MSYLLLGDSPTNIQKPRTYQKSPDVPLEGKSGLLGVLANVLNVSSETGEQPQP